MNAMAPKRDVWECEGGLISAAPAIGRTPCRSAPKAVHDRALAFPLRSIFLFGWELAAFVPLQIRNAQSSHQQQVYDRQNANQNIHVSPTCSPPLTAEAPDIGFAQNPFTYREGAGVFP